jgi:hypothetical protein
MRWVLPWVRMREALVPLYFHVPLFVHGVVLRHDNFIICFNGMAHKVKVLSVHISDSPNHLTDFSEIWYVSAALKVG